MPIDEPRSDTSRAIQHDPDRLWPRALGIRAEWPNGMVSYIPITLDQFFGTGRFGAPLSGDAVIGSIKNMLAGGEPPLPPKKRPKKHVKKPSVRGRKDRAVGNRKGVAVRGKRKSPS